MKRFRKIIIIIVSIFFFFVLLHIGVNLWIEKQLPKIINRENDSAYNIIYDKVEISLINTSIHAEKIMVTPKYTIKDSLSKTGIYANIKAIDVTGFSIWSVLFSDRIKARSIRITKPDVVLYKKSEKAIDNSKSISAEVVKPFEKIIVVSDIFLDKGNVKILNILNNKTILNARDINVKLEGIVITDDILERKIPFSYKSYAFDCDSIFYQPNSFYQITTKKVTTTALGINIKNFTMIPQHSRKQFVKEIKTEKDIYTIKVKDIDVRDMEWGYKDTVFFFHSKNVALDNVAADIYRNKLQDDDMKKKKLYNELLRNLKFDLDIKTLKISNSFIMYEEEKSFDKGPGKLTFSQFNMTVNNIHSGFRQMKLPDMKINIACIFMKESALRVNWRLNVLDKSEGFNIRGRILNFDAAAMTPFVKPYMNVTTKGILKEVYFNFTGNDISSKGDFAVRYDDLKVTVYRKKDREKKNGFLTWIGNLLVKNDTKGELASTEVSVKRKQECSFYNFLWLNIAEGLKKIII